MVTYWQSKLKKTKRYRRTSLKKDFLNSFRRKFYVKEVIMLLFVCFMLMILWMYLFPVAQRIKPVLVIQTPNPIFEFQQSAIETQIRSITQAAR